MLRSPRPQTAIAPIGCTIPARAASVAERPGPHCRAGRLDALGRSARGALDHPRRRAPGHRSIRPIPSSWLFSIGMALLGTWTALIPNKVDRDPPVRRDDRRLIALAAGLLVGVVGTGAGAERADSA